MRLKKNIVLSVLSFSLLSAGCDSEKNDLSLTMNSEGRDFHSFNFVQIDELRTGRAKETEVRSAMTPVVQLTSAEMDGFEPIPIEFNDDADGNFVGNSPVLDTQGIYMVEVDWQIRDSSQPSDTNAMASIALVKYALEFDGMEFSVPASNNNENSCVPDEPCSVPHETDSENEPVFADSDGDVLSNLQELNMGTSWIGEGAENDPFDNGVIPDTADLDNRELVIVSALEESPEGVKAEHQTEWSAQGELVITDDSDMRLATWGAHFENTQVSILLKSVEGSDPPIKGRVVAGRGDNQIREQGEPAGDNVIINFDAALISTDEGFRVQLIVQDAADVEIGRNDYTMILQGDNDQFPPPEINVNKPEITFLNGSINNECTPNFKIQATTSINDGQTLKGEWTVSPPFDFGTAMESPENGAWVSTIEFTVPLIKNDNGTSEKYIFTYTASDAADESNSNAADGELTVTDNGLTECTAR